VRKQVLGERAFSRPDLHGQRCTLAARCPGDPVEDFSAAEEMLAELLPRH